MGLSNATLVMFLLHQAGTNLALLRSSLVSFIKADRLTGFPAAT